LAGGGCPPRCDMAHIKAERKVSMQINIVSYQGKDSSDMTVFVDGKPPDRWVSTPDITLGSPVFDFSPEHIESMRETLKKVSETFAAFADYVRLIVADYTHCLKASGFFDIDWGAIAEEEKAHERRFTMYQRRYARGKRK